MSRTSDRQQHATEVRVVLLEGDMDVVTEDVRELTASLKRLIGVLIGMVISLGTAVLLLAANLMVGR